METSRTELALDTTAAFEVFLRRQGRSVGTRRKYLPVVRDFLAWASDQPLGYLTVVDVDLYLAEWEAQHERSFGRAASRGAGEA